MWDKRPGCSYFVSLAIVLMSLTTLAVSSGDAPPSVKIFRTPSNIVFCWTAVNCAPLKMAWTNWASFGWAARSFSFPAMAVVRSSASLEMDSYFGFIPRAAMARSFVSDCFRTVSEALVAAFAMAVKSFRRLSMFCIVA